MNLASDYYLILVGEEYRQGDLDGGGEAEFGRVEEMQDFTLSAVSLVKCRYLSYLKNTSNHKQP